MAYALDTLAGYLRDIPVIADRVRREARGAPLVGSHISREVDELPGEAASFLYDAFSGAALRSAAVEDMIGGIGDLIASRIFPQYAAARSAAEYAARAWWLMDPGLGAVRRARRGYTDRRESLLAQMSILGMDGRESAVRRLDEVDGHAHAAGLGGNMRRDRPPSMTTLMRMIWGAEYGSGSDLGDSVYSLLSAHSHGTLFALTYLAGGQPDDDDDHPVLRMRSFEQHADREAGAVALAITPYMHAVDRFMRLAAWDGTELMAHLGYTSSEVQRHVRSSSGS